MSGARFVTYLPLAVDSLLYCVYTALFLRALTVLTARQRRAHMRTHLACISALFLLSTIHIVCAYVWALIADRGATAVYSLFSLKVPTPVLFDPGDPKAVRTLAVILRVRYLLSNQIADAVVIHRCYIIWDRRWPAMVPLLIAYTATFVGGICHVLPLPVRGQQAAVATAVASAFITNVGATSLAAFRIWTISRRARGFREESNRVFYANITAIIVESGLVYPAVLLLTCVLFLFHDTFIAVLVGVAAVYQVVGIAPMLIVVRVGLGTSTDNPRPTAGNRTHVTTIGSARNRSGAADMRLEVIVRTEEEEMFTDGEPVQYVAASEEKSRLDLGADAEDVGAGKGA
ncbi:unnamed protein product [Mycena citricolor]|uniref:Uncharacterized protein n=1 Tax=Mycena citricolor TaxID=2018698 RepID=A0AAD2HIE2_9AGAR|nr:unnamed protein product [Mycena citricolor]